MLFLVWVLNEYNQVPLFYLTDAPAEEFIPNVYGLDVHDIMIKFEGYSIASCTLSGMATSYREKVLAAKKKILTKLNVQLCEYGPQLCYSLLIFKISNH